MLNDDIRRRKRFALSGENSTARAAEAYRRILAERSRQEVERATQNMADAIRALRSLGLTKAEATKLTAGLDGLSSVDAIITQALRRR